MTPTKAKQWNQQVDRAISRLTTTKSWLKQFSNDSGTDWESQKSAHQALKFLELAEYEMLNMQYWWRAKEQSLYLDAEKTVAR